MADTTPQATQLLLLVREWQEARQPVAFDAPGVGVAETYHRAVARRAAADAALAEFDLNGPAGGARDGLTEPSQSTGISERITADLTTRHGYLSVLVRRWQRRAIEYERLAEETMSVNALDVSGRFRGREQAIVECLTDLQEIMADPDEARLLSEALDACLDDYNRMKHTVDLQREQFAHETLARSAAEARATQAEQRADLFYADSQLISEQLLRATSDVARLTWELDTVREVLNTDLKISSDRVLALELENQRLTRELAEARSEHCRDCCCARAWKALGGQTRKESGIVEHIEHLRVERDALTRELAEAHARGDAAMEMVVKLGTEMDRFVPYLKDGESPFERLKRERSDTDTLLGQLAQSKLRAERAEAERDAAREALRPAWEAGFKLAVSYGDNWIHFDGEQKERQWQRFLAALGQPSEPPV